MDLEKVIDCEVRENVTMEEVDGIEYPGLKLGADVVFSKVLGRVMCLGGVADVQVELSTDEKIYKLSTIKVARNAIARTKMDRIVISYE